MKIQRHVQYQHSQFISQTGSSDVNECLTMDILAEVHIPKTPHAKLMIMYPTGCIQYTHVPRSLDVEKKINIMHVLYYRALPSTWQ